MAHSTPYHGICARCGKPFESYDYRLNRIPKYCSRGCAQPNRRAIQIVNCSVCGQEFERKRYHVEMSGERGQFCSFRCYGHWQRKNMNGPANPFYNPDRHTSHVCDWCGKEFERAKYIRGGELHFCNRSCFQEFAKENFRRRLPFGYGKSWRSAKSLAMKRDQSRCQSCGSEMDLVVHHIQAYKTFENAADAHVLDNLVTLCRACHCLLHNQPTT